MDLVEVSMVYIVYVSEEIWYINDVEGNWSKGNTLNNPTSLVS